MSKNKIEEKDDEIKFLNKYREMKTQDKILICLYILIALMVINITLPYITKLNIFKNNSTKVTSDTYDISMFNMISIDDFNNIANKDEAQVIFVGTNKDSNCLKFLPVLQQAQNDYGYVTNYLDVEEIDSENAKEIIKNYDRESFFKNALGTTPMIVIVKNGKFINGWVGYSNYDDFSDFLENSGMEK